MLKVFSSIVDYRKEKGNFFNWVYTIVRNTALDKLRPQHRSMLTTDHNNGIENLPENANGHNPLIALEGKELYHLLDQLSPATRMVCNLYYIEGYSVRDIATRLEIAEGTVKWQLSEGRKKLRTVLEKQLNQRT